MPTLPTQDQVQAKFDAARDVGLSPCAWIPPKWEKLESLDAGKRRGFQDNSGDDGGDKFGFSNKITATNKTSASQRGNDCIQKGKAKNKPGNPEDSQDPNNWANPFADFTHTDDSEFSANDLGTIEQALPKDQKGQDVLGRLKRIVGAESQGMKRLGQIFEWALYRTTELMTDMNDALDQWTPQQQNLAQAKYEEAQQNYIAFLRDLDNHEPGKREEKKLDVKDKKSPSGYGRSLKWACIDPVIFNGRIVGTRVVIHWNPHSSSDGKPIPHNP